MSTNQTERATCEGMFATGWALLSSPPPVNYENTPFNAPSNAPWVRMVIRPGASATGSIGPDIMNINLGRVWVQIFVPENTGTDEARTLADSAAAIFAHQRKNGLLFLAAEYTAVGAANGLYQYNVSIPYRRYSTDPL